MAVWRKMCGDTPLASRFNDRLEALGDAKDGLAFPLDDTYCRRTPLSFQCRLSSGARRRCGFI
jgi:hypothetical protein